MAPAFACCGAALSTPLAASALPSTSGRHLKSTKEVSTMQLQSSFFGRSRSKGGAALLGAQARGGQGRIVALFGVKFGKDGLDSKGAGIYGSQTREEFSSSDCEHYFEYSGMLAMEGSYASIQAILDSGVHPADVLLLLAATEGDVPKIDELLKAGADIHAKDLSGRTALDRAQDESIRELLLSGAKELSPL
eukprot:TRINITY_DN18302_c0_g1_i1.p1 TRINITY_DN18302_c0_g1~~TRINITY_DN18302_c0_g1_i1.p1  ORF type:complete len:192 (-),score=46.22 TRINITY_DN18302_c0_g1_i1:339-914(-)